MKQINTHLLKQAKQLVMSSGNLSISFVQRKLGIGYNRSAELMAEIKKSYIKRKPDRKRLVSKSKKCFRHV